MPNTIADNLQRLQTARNNIAAAITARGGTVQSGDGFEDFSSEIAAVPNQYDNLDEGKVVSNGALTAQTATSASANGTVDTTTNNSIVINVPNSYGAGDEWKVVHNGALVSQTSTSVSQNGTIDTTLNNSVTVQVPEGAKTGTITTDYSGSSKSNVRVTLSDGIIMASFTENEPVQGANYRISGLGIPDNTNVDFESGCARIASGSYMSFQYLGTIKVTNDTITLDKIYLSVTSVPAVISVVARVR